MANKQRIPMSIENRAKQFMPFSALKGLYEELSSKEMIIIDKKELSQEMAEELDLKMHQIKKGDIITVIYYNKDEYLKKTGIISSINETARYIQIVNERISFDDLFDILL